jgi:uncharacterized protein YjbJ (UPF0337 family)
MNEEIVKGKWKEIKGEIKTMWGKMTDDELEKTSGNLATIGGLIEKRYGLKKEEVQGKLEGIVAKFAEKTQGIKKSIKEGPGKDSSAHP